jgi:N-acetylneuraminate lyase
MKTHGLIAAPPTAFHTDGSIDLAAVAPLAQHLQRQGVAGVFVNGTTGEGMSLTTEERETLAVEWRRVLPAGMTLFIHAGHNCLGEAQRLTRHAQAIGADAVAVIAPSFFKPSGVAGVVDWCAAIAAEVPALPIYFYHMPSMTNVSLSIADFLTCAGPRIPNLAGIKFTFEAMGDFLQALQLDGGRFDMLWGRDEMLLGALAMGARGGVGSTFNVIAPLYLDLICAFDAGDFPRARELQLHAVRFINSLAGTGNFFAALKYVLQAQGVPIAPTVRAPLAPLTDAQFAQIILPSDLV